MVSQEVLLVAFFMLILLFAGAVLAIWLVATRED